MKKLKSEIILKVYCDICGGVWDFLKVDGSFSTFQPGTAEYLDYKTFKTPETALKFGNANYKRFQVIRNDPPVPPNIEWPQTILHDVSL